ncbi:MAG: hypothetical protein M3252_03490 [Actinomycetota bacterium]|nr:hypothetical protein [Actinomycetota bacterium]
MRDAVAATIERAGFVLVGKTERGLEAVGLAGDVRPDVAVIHLALLGTLGLRLIPTLQAAAPGCLVVVLSPLDTLVVPALEAGAHAVVAENDVLGLAAELGAIARSRLSPA